MTDENDPLASDAELSEGYIRLRKALSRLDTRTGEVLAIHIALEAEIDLTFEELFPHPIHLKKLGFGNKVRVLQAVYNELIVDMIAEPLLAFDALRNSIAHRHERREINRCFKAVCERLRLEPETATIQGIGHALASGLVLARRELTPTS